MKIVALPRDPNPYQELLYGQMRSQGNAVRYGACLTTSRTLNLLLLPIELVVLRARGFDVLHLHWVFGFRFPTVRSHRRPGHFSRWWFYATLWIARWVGLTIVWTAHNVLPHNPVFDHDVAARRRLLDYADLVIAHSESAVAEVEATFGRRAPVRVVPHGLIEPPGLASVRSPEFATPRRILFFGKIEAYKGVEDLRDAADGLDVPRRIEIAGGCSDIALRERISTRAAALAGSVTVDFGRVPDEQVASLFERADALVYPFRAVTTSGSVLLGLVAGRPIVVPDLPVLGDLPAAAVIRYPAGVVGLRDALRRVAQMPASELAGVARAAEQAARDTPGWSEIASVTAAYMREARSVRRSRGRGAGGIRSWARALAGGRAE